MSNNFLEDFNTILDGILTDYRNQLPGADTSQGSLIFIKSACLASALWGLYHYQEYISRQIFADSSDTINLEHHAWVRGLSRTYGETDAALLARLLEYIRRPPAGGNRYDYIKWATAVDNVHRAWCYPLSQGLGTVDVVILANETTTGSEIPSSSARIGITTTATASKLIDSGASFSTGHAVAAGDIVENPLRETRTTVTAVDSTTQLSLDNDIFKFVNEPYIVHCQTGTNTSVSAGKLIDSAGAFTNTTYTVKKGDVAENVTDAKQTTVTSVDSATQLSLVQDIFTATGKTYVIRGLVGEVKKYIDPLRPVTGSKVSIIAPTTLTQAVTMTVTRSGLDRTVIAADIAAYMAGMEPGQILYLSKLIQIAMDDGADNVSISVPSGNVTPTSYQMIRPGAINVS